jgi:DNA-binding NarL/FixJ family response regulator
MSHRIVLVGHCGVDAPRLEREIKRVISDAQIVRCANDESFATACEEGGDLFVFNREMPYGFESDQGLEMMRELHDRQPDARMMLISDYDDAQSQARQLGAVDGFGKADLGTEKVEQRLREALN